MANTVALPPVNEFQVTVDRRRTIVSTTIPGFRQVGASCLDFLSQDVRPVIERAVDHAFKHGPSSRKA